MLVVQRKSDGLYYRGLRSNSGYGREQWTADINDVLPFRNMSAVKNVLRPTRQFKGEEECCKAVKWNYNGYKNLCKHFKAQRATEEAQFWLRYRVFAANIQRMEEINRDA